MAAVLRSHNNNDPPSLLFAAIPPPPLIFQDSSPPAPFSTCSLNRSPSFRSVKHESGGTLDRYLGGYQTQGGTASIRSVRTTSSTTSGERKSAVERLEESKANYVKSERVLDSRQELKSAQHLRVADRQLVDELYNKIPLKHLHSAPVGGSNDSPTNAPPPPAPKNSIVNEEPQYVNTVALRASGGYGLQSSNSPPEPAPSALRRTPSARASNDVTPAARLRSKSESSRTRRHSKPETPQEVVDATVPYTSSYRPVYPQVTSYYHHNYHQQLPPANQHTFHPQRTPSHFHSTAIYPNLLHPQQLKRPNGDPITVQPIVLQDSMRARHPSNGMHHSARHSSTLSGAPYYQLSSTAHALHQPISLPTGMSAYQLKQSIGKTQEEILDVEQQLKRLLLTNGSSYDNLLSLSHSRQRQLPPKLPVARSSSSTSSTDDSGRVGESPPVRARSQSGARVRRGHSDPLHHQQTSRTQHSRKRTSRRLEQSLEHKSLPDLSPANQIRKEHRPRSTSSSSAHSQMSTSSSGERLFQPRSRPTSDYVSSSSHSPPTGVRSRTLTPSWSPPSRGAATLPSKIQRNTKTKENVIVTNPALASPKTPRRTTHPPAGLQQNRDLTQSQRRQNFPPPDLLAGHSITTQAQVARGPPPVPRHNQTFNCPDGIYEAEYIYYGQEPRSRNPVYRSKSDVQTYGIVKSTPNLLQLHLSPPHFGGGLLPTYSAERHNPIPKPYSTKHSPPEHKPQREPVSTTKPSLNHKFFDSLGLDTISWHHVIAADSPSTPPEFFESVPSYDSNAESSSDSASSTSSNVLNKSGLNATRSILCRRPSSTGTGLRSRDLQRNSGSVPDMSIIEKNARVIKWLCQCRKAMAQMQQGVLL